MSSLTDFPWTDAYLLGYPPMDDTHREFVVIVSALLAAEDNEVAGHLEAFAKHA
jgi:hemerythrin